ncbi:two-component system, sensor histidine kinase [Gammaproteobacteria bacterium]
MTHSISPSFRTISLKISPLARQVTVRLLLVLGIFFIVWVTLTSIIYSLTFEKYYHASVNNAHSFLDIRVQELEMHWKSDAIAFKTGLEFSKVLESPNNQWEQLQNYLTLLGGAALFDRVRILNRDDRLQFDSIPEAKGHEIILSQDNDIFWYFDEIDKKLFRIIRSSAWLGTEGMGFLELFKAVDNQLLFLNNYPGGDLHLFWNGREIASSTGRFLSPAKSSFSLRFWDKPLELDIPWASNGKTDAILHVQQFLPQLLTLTDLLKILLFSITTFSILLFVFLGKWLSHLTGRIRQLRDIANDFIRDYRLPTTLRSSHVRGRSDELCEMADALEYLTRAVRDRDVARNHTERELRASEQALRDSQRILEEHQKKLEQLIALRTAALEASEEQLRLILDSSAAGIFGTDIEDRITFINPAACELLGYQPEELIGQLAHEKFHNRYPNGSLYPRDKCPIAAALIQGQVSRSYREMFWRANGEGIPITYASQPMWHESRIVGSVVSFFDITAQIEAEKALEGALFEAQRLTRVKSEFLASMSHEIRTPMNAIIGFAEVVLQDSTLSPPTAGHTRTILSSARALLEIINDILDVSKLESGKFSIETVCFHLPNALTNSIQTIRDRATRKNLTLNLEYDAALPIRCLGDPTRLRQVILNLVDNAIKFTENGGVTISAMRGDEPEMCHFMVSDTGIGMTPAQLTQVFEPFTQADQSTTRRFGGTGLGTTLSKQIVELMNGQIWVESNVNVGSTFHFTARLPPTMKTMGCLYEEDQTIVEGYLSPRLFQVLLAEDLKENAILVTLRLEQQGHNITWVKNGREVVDTYLNGDHDLILMDVMMPEMDGLEATKEIRRIENSTGRSIPIMALTASVMHEDNGRCLAAGMDAIMPKPIDFDRLLAVMEQIVPSGSGRTNSATEVGIRTGNFISVDFSPLEGIVNHQRAIKTWCDPVAYAKALVSFSIHHAHDAEEIVRLLSESSDNIESARTMVHALKGLASNLFVCQVAVLATEIDKHLRTGQGSFIGSNLHELHHSLEEAVAAISRLSLSLYDPQEELKAFNQHAVLELLDELLYALDGLNPDTIEPIMAKLAEYVLKSRLAPIQECVDAFDFNEARNKTQALIDQIKIAAP